jgi:hypothetical protein
MYEIFQQQKKKILQWILVGEVNSSTTSKNATSLRIKKNGILTMTESI